MGRITEKQYQYALERIASRLCLALGIAPAAMLGL